MPPPTAHNERYNSRVASQPIALRTVSGTLPGVARDECDLAATLQSGQVFRWRFDAGDGAWRGFIEHGYAVKLSQGDGDTLFYELTGNIAAAPDAERAVRRFLRLDDLRLADAAETWAGADAHFAEAWANHPGIRVVRQDPHECFFSFLCASVAPIARIGAMLKAVASECAGDAYGVFPPAPCLADTSEETFRALGLGFRAKRIAEAARRVAALPSGFLRDLRQATPADAKRELVTFFGVGEKIADCVALFSLDKDAAIPVDTHIWRMARAWYLPELADASLTAANYAKVGQAFFDRFGDRCGWAQQTLFYRAAVGARSGGKTKRVRVSGLPSAPGSSAPADAKT